MGIAMLLIAGLVAMTVGLSDGGDERAEIIDLVEAIAAESAAVTNGYFSGPESVAQVTADSLEKNPDDEVVIDLLRSLTAAHSNVAGTFIGYPDGSFTDVRRDDTEVDGSFRVKTIELLEGERTVDVEIVDRARRTVEQFVLPEDTYDPRVRPWYIGAEAADSYWTEPYVFFTSQEPGITHSVPVLDDSGSLIAVVGVDITLTDLQAFLVGRRPSENGGAAVLSAEGELVAGDTQLLGDPEGDEAIQNLLTSLPNPEAGQVITAQDVDGDNLRVVAGTRVGQGETQLLVVDAPAEDFLQAIRSTRRGYALLAAALGLLGILLLAFCAALTAHYMGKLAQMARTDPLTGLLNRTALHEQTSTALKAGSDVAVMALDLDNFKTVNDQFGHEGGDSALKRVAERLQLATPENSILGRLGGDEFCIVLIDHSDPAQTLRSMVDAAGGSVDTRDYSFDLDFSAGYSLSSSTNPTSTDALLRNADVAMYQAKAKKGTSMMEFNETMHMRWQDDDERKATLVAAIESGEIELHFQPELDLNRNVVIGAEGLLRWQHPEHGLVPAADFIADLERFGLMAGLLPRMFAKATELANAVSSPQEFTIRINMSSEQILVTDLLDHIKWAVGTTETKWCLEVSEHVMAQSTPEVRAIFGKVRELGARVTIDNYGTGHSSLAELQLLPVDEIKIPRRFVQELDATNAHTSVAAVLIDLAAATGLDATVTGIENECERNALVDAGIQQGQGYLFGEPVPMSEFIDIWYEERLVA